jgi:DNA-binding transcriptional LysR family regulator
VEIRQLEHFVAVAEERSFTRAAQRLNYVQSALSASIQALERELGVRLFDRDTRRVALTDAGAELLPTVRETLASFEHTRDTAAALNGIVRGSVRIGMMQSFAFLDVPHLIGEFHRRYPDVEIHMHAAPGGSSAMIGELRAGDLDIAFASITDDPPGLAVTDLAIEELDLIGRPDLLPPGTGPVTLADLAGEAFVDLPQGWGVRTAIDAAFTSARMNRRVTIEIADIRTFLDMLQAGLGIGIAPRSLLPAGYPLQMRRIVPAITWRIVMALPARRPVRGTAAALAELVTAELTG